MDHKGMLANGIASGVDGSDARKQTSHHAPMRTADTQQDAHKFARPYSGGASRSLRSHGGGGASSGAGGYSSPAKKDKKHILFQLIDPENPQIHARLPMRVMISTTDTTESIIATIKNFYGLYDYGVSFENKDGVSMIAAYENFDHDMSVYVRTVALPPAQHGDLARDSASPKKPTLGAPIELRSGAGNSPSRSAARSGGVRSMSPQLNGGYRSNSATAGAKPRSQRTKSKDNGAYGDTDGYSSDDNGEGSVASSRRSKAEVVNAEISVDNIVEGGRRKRAFESSELPLFVPPQVPMTASISSVSPQRRAGPPHAASPYASANQQTFSYQQPLPSPISHGSGPGYGPSGMASNGSSSLYAPVDRQLRGRPGAVMYPPRYSGNGISPTPDPTVASAISDEDVALQLMRLGDPMAFSQGRTSNSTLDDALSGKAEAASSDEDDEEEGDDDDIDDEHDHHHQAANGSRLSNGSSGPMRKKQRIMNELPSDATSGDDYDDHRDGTFDASHDPNSTSGNSHRKKPKATIKSRPSATTSTSANGVSKARSNSGAAPRPLKTKTSLPNSNVVNNKGLISPASMPAPASSRKGSIVSSSSAGGNLTFQHPLGVDEEDLSTKPRCQRCRKSKKGCDRQRPCGRCKDAGIGIEGCISEDEGNGRKGRYGRHMGVPVKKSEDGGVGEEGLYSAATTPQMQQLAGHPQLHNHHLHHHQQQQGTMLAGVNGKMTMHDPVATGQVLAPLAGGAAYAAGLPMPMHGVESTAASALNDGFLAPALPDKSKKRKR